MKYLLIYGSCGHGHQRAAEYIADELRLRGERDVTIIDFIAYTTSFFKTIYPFVYKYAVTYLPLLWKWGFDVTNIKELNWFIRLIRRWANHFHAKKLENFIVHNNPEVIILTHFLPSEVCSYLKGSNKISSHVVTMVTDTIAHATWVNKNSDYFVGMADETKKALIEWGIRADRIKVLGIPVASKFKRQNMRDEFLKKYALDPSLLTVLITSGSFGIGPIEKLVFLLNRYQNKIQVIVVCGNNKSLFNRLQQHAFSVPVKLFQFVSFMDELMEASDIVIAKSGGLTMCESLAKELPLVISRPIPGQETYNAQFLLSHNAAYQIHRVGEIEPIIDSILKDKSVLEVKKEYIRKISRPNATADVVDFLLTSLTK
ncbi:MAG: glycosyltransferase [Candidatus Omnitrophota bacterium]